MKKENMEKGVKIYGEIKELEPALVVMARMVDHLRHRKAENDIDINSRMVIQLEHYTFGEHVISYDLNTIEAVYSQLLLKKKKLEEELAAL